MTDPLVSVMIGAYDAEAYLSEAVESVLTQSYRPLELIVVDDGSSDQTADVARSYGDRLTLIVQENRGAGAARNRATEAATGDYFAFLDADDRFVDGKLEQQMAALQTHPDVDAVFGHVTEFVSPDVGPEARLRLRTPTQDVPWMAPNLMLIRRGSFMRVGLFSEKLRVGETVDWLARAQEAGLQHLMLPVVVLERRLHASNTGIRNSEARAEYAHVLKAAIDRRRATGR